MDRAIEPKTANPFLEIWPFNHLSIYLGLDYTSKLIFIESQSILLFLAKIQDDDACVRTSAHWYLSRYSENEQCLQS